MLNKIKRIPSGFILFLVVLSTLLAARSMFESGYFIMHDDLQMMRQLQMEKCFLDGQIPCRWVPDMGYGYGFPLFNYYPPLPYLIGEVFRILGFAFTSTVKLTFALSFVVSGFGMYFLAKKFYGRLGGLMASVFYVWAPYHAIDVFIRGAMNESWALALFPFLFLYIAKIISDDSKYLFKNSILLGIFFAGLLLSHNLMVLIITPFLIVWGLIHLLDKKQLRRVVYLPIAGTVALGLSGFFTIPVFFERNLVKIDQLTEDYYVYVAHFVSLKQLFWSRYWGDGPSTWGIENDRMGFSVGHLHWMLTIVVFILICIVLVKNRTKLKNVLSDNKIKLTLFFLVMGYLALFMTHSRSAFIWEAFPGLAIVQFPWRFLSLGIFGISIAIGAIPIILKNYFEENFLEKFVVGSSRYIFTFLVCLILIIFNWSWFRPIRSGPVSDAQKFSGEAWRLQQVAGIRDYLPVTASTDPKSQRNIDYEIKSGEAIINDYNQGTNWAKFKVNTVSDTATVKLGILYFPNWEVRLDGIQIASYVPDDEEWGRMWVDIPKGEHVLYAELLNTPIRTVSNIVSLASWILLLFYFWYVKNLNKIKK